MRLKRLFKTVYQPVAFCWFKTYFMTSTEEKR